MARLPSFPRMGWLEYPFPVAVKTGTSSGTHDAWTVAWSQRYLVGAWVGHPDFRPMTGLSGYHSAARLVRDVLLHLHASDADGLTDVGFPPPRGWHPVKLCALTGRRATPATDRIVVEHFPPGAEPVDSSQAHVRLAVDRRTGLLATTATPRSEVQVRTFVQLPPRYAEWQASAGLVPPPRDPSPLGADGSRALLSPVSLGPDRRLAVARIERDPGITITSPRTGLDLVRDPETPPDRATLALRATVDPPVEQLVWYVDGLPYTIADHPYTARWPLAPGDHTIQARVPFGSAVSALVHLTVR
jgi:penicillin-binding protein 1C